MSKKKEDMITSIISREWDFFDKVQNKGGRAGCQDDFETFNIMRKSQFLAWNEETLKNYLEVLVEIVVEVFQIKLIL